jgi:hypothetical protein
MAGKAQAARHLVPSVRRSLAVRGFGRGNSAHCRQEGDRAGHRNAGREDLSVGQERGPSISVNGTRPYAAQHHAYRLVVMVSVSGMLSITELRNAAFLQIQPRLVTLLRSAVMERSGYFDSSRHLH